MINYSKNFLGLLFVTCIVSCNLSDKTSKSSQLQKAIKDTVRIYDYSNFGYQFRLKLFKDSFAFVDFSDSITGLVNYSEDDVKLDLESVHNNKTVDELQRIMHGISMVKTFQFNEVAPLMIVPTNVGYFKKTGSPAESNVAQFYRGTGYKSSFINLKADHSLIFCENNDLGQNDSTLGNWKANDKFIYTYNFPDDASIYKYSQNGIFFIFGELLIGRKVHIINHTAEIECFYFVKR